MAGKFVPLTDSFIMQEFIVSNLEDENDGNFSEGDLSLREAIAISNSNDIINFAEDLSGGTIVLSQGELLIDKSLSLNGLGFEQLTIDANNNSRVFNLNDGTETKIDVAIDGLVITGGNAASEELGDFGGGLFNQENLQLNNSQIINNDAIAGGGIYNLDATLTVNNSAIADNSIPGNNSVDSRGAGIANLRSTVEINNSSIENNIGTGIDAQDSEINITDSSVSNNSDIGTGGIRSVNSTVKLENSQVNNNSSSALGLSGGISSLQGSTLRINNSTVSGNFGDPGGAGDPQGRRADASGILADGTTFVSNSTISGNRGVGFGIKNRGSLNVINSTFADNEGTAIVNQSNGISFIGNSTIANNTVSISEGTTAGGIINSQGEVSLLSTIVANNGAGDTPNIAGEISGSNNLIGKGENLTGLGDYNIIGTIDNPVDAGLGTLQDNGGNTPTIAISADSPAIDKGNDGGNRDLPFDQRGEGFPRRVGDGQDIGAFELQEVTTEVPNITNEISTDLIVSTLEDENDGDFSEGDLSLREAIAIAESGDNISFSSNLSGATINLSLGELVIDKNLTINGLGSDQLTIDAGNNSRVFNIDDGSEDSSIDVTLDGLAIANGRVTQDNSNGRGGGVFTTENLELVNSSISGNFSSSAGGGIYSSGDRLRIDNSNISNNSAQGILPLLGTNGGGIATVGTTVEITNTSIDNNTAALDGGGGLDVRDSQVTIADSFFNNNFGLGAGGINSANSNVSLDRTVVSGNRTGLIGGSGAIDSDANSVLNIDRSTIDGNSGVDPFNPSPPRGSQAFVSGIGARGTTTITNSTISNSVPERIDDPLAADEPHADIPQALTGFGIKNTGNLNVTNSTFAGSEDGGINNDGGSVNVSNTTIADGLANVDLSNLTSTIVVDDSQVEAAIDSNQNLIGNSDSLNLGELQDNGGATQTLALSADSQAIDAGSNPNDLATDQRGEEFDRTVGNGTDIGAFELQSKATPTTPEFSEALVVSTLEDENDDDFSDGDLSLREAIANANSGDTITFSSNLSGGTINLSLGDLVIDRSLNIQGLGADVLTIDAGKDAGNGDVRVFKIDDGDESTLADVNLSGLTITGGNTGRFFGSNAGNIENAEGGGIFNAENLRVENSVIRDNTAILFGGGIYNQGKIFVANSTISDNNITTNGLPTSGDAGGLFNQGIATIDNTTVTRNVGISAGGLLNSTSETQPIELFIRNSTITDNSGIDRQGIPEPFSIGAGAGVAGNNRTAILSSIIANNETDITGEALSDGNNLIGNADGFADVDESDIVGTADNPLDPLLGELQNNGGSTPTQALLNNSPAIDAGKNLNNLTTDQRGEGFDRTVGAGTDVGAFEVQGNNSQVPDIRVPDVQVPDIEIPNLEGTDGNDSLSGSDTDDDIILGGAGDDTLNGNGGHDNIDGGIGDDLISGGEGDDLLDGNDGHNEISGENGDDTLFGGKDNELLNGGADDDLLVGAAGHDSLSGNSGHDVINGEEGNDFIDGGEGDDLLTGGAGADTLIGGAGHDVFILEASDVYDTVVDFELNSPKGLAPGGPTHSVLVSSADTGTSCRSDRLQLAESLTLGQLSIVDNESNTGSLIIDTNNHDAVVALVENVRAADLEVHLIC